MTELNKALTAILAATLADEANTTLTHLTGGCQLVVTFPPLTDLGASKDGAEPYDKFDDWYGVDMDAEVASEAMQEAVKVLFGGLVPDSPLMQCIHDGKMYVFRESDARCACLHGYRYTDEPTDGEITDE